MEPQIPPYISISFILLVFFLLIWMVLVYKEALIRSGIDEATRKQKVRRLAIPLLFWLLLLARISDMSFFHSWSAMPPRLMIAGVPPLIFAILFISSKKLKDIIGQIPQHWLILIQSFRVIMEIILLLLFLQNIIPEQMTFEGYNVDILTGITALPVAYFVYRKKVSANFIIGWNIFGLLLLVNIFVIAVLSAPFSFRVFMNEPANTVIAYFPFVWLPGFVVPVAYTMHFISIKKCLAEKKLNQETSPL